MSVSERMALLPSPIIHLHERIVSALIAIPTPSKVRDSAVCHFLSNQIQIQKRKNPNIIQRRIFPTEPITDQTSERKKKAPRKSMIHQIFASGRSEKNSTIQFGRLGSSGVFGIGSSISIPLSIIGISLVSSQSSSGFTRSICSPHSLEIGD